MARRRLTLEEIEREITGEHVCTSKRCHRACPKRVERPVRGFRAPPPARRRADVLRSACARGGAATASDIAGREVMLRIWANPDAVPVPDPVSVWMLHLIRALDVELDSMA